MSAKDLISEISEAQQSRDFEMAALVSLELAEEMTYSDPARSRFALGQALVYATLARGRRRPTT